VETAWTTIRIPSTQAISFQRTSFWRSASGTLRAEEITKPIPMTLSSPASSGAW
jgi:hypothetical protein